MPLEQIAHKQMDMWDDAVALEQAGVAHRSGLKPKRRGSQPTLGCMAAPANPRKPIFEDDAMIAYDEGGVAHRIPYAGVNRDDLERQRGIERRERPLEARFDELQDLDAFARELRRGRGT